MSGLSPEQLKAVSAVARGASSPEIAKELGITERTIQRWKKHPDFIAALDSIQDKATAQVVAEVSDDIASRLESLIPKALDTLESYIDNPEARGSDRLRACHIVGSWAGLNQPKPQEPKTAAEDTLKGYLQYLASTNGTQAQTRTSG